MARKSRRSSAPGGNSSSSADSGAAVQFRAPAVAIVLRELLGRLPEAVADGHPDQWIHDGAVAVDGEVWMRGRRREPVPAGSVVSLSAGTRSQAVASVLEPIDVHSGTVWRALVLKPAWATGEFDGEGGAVGFEVGEARSAVAELVLEERHELPEPVDLAVTQQRALRLLAGLAAMGHPVVGDWLHGGVLTPGGLRLMPLAPAMPPPLPIDGGSGVSGPPGPAPPLAEFVWPSEPLLLGRAPASGSTDERLAVSFETARILERGHPWVLRDEDSGDPQRYRPGALVRLETSAGRAAGFGLVDGEGDRVARRWAPAGPTAGASIAARVDAALERRGALLGAEATDALRLVHGEADGLPGLAIDRLGSVVRVLVHGRSALELRDVARDAVLHGLRERIGLDAAAVEVIHLRRPKGVRLGCTRQVSGAPIELDADGRYVVRERGLRFSVDVGLMESARSAPGVGLFLDQRENRARLTKRVSAERASGSGHWLNLFAHTGAFSVALLAAGAQRVTSVDLSARYLHWLDANLELNRDLGVDGGHHTGIRRDGRRFLEELPPRERFRGIVLDPPTAAAAGRHFWSIRKDLEPLIEKSLEHLEVGGWLLVARNDRAARGPSLRDAVEAASQRIRVELTSVEDAGPGRDFPRLRGFPEGESFRALLVQRGPGA